MMANSDFKIKKMSLQLLVTNLDHSIDFYTNQLGFEIDFSYEDFYCGIIKNGHSIHLKLSETAIKEREKNNEDLDIIFSVSDIENLYEDIKHRQIKIIQSLRNMPYGREFYIADPDKHVIGFLEENDQVN